MGKLEFPHFIVDKEVVSYLNNHLIMYDNLRHKLTAVTIIILLLITCVAGETWPFWVSSFLIM